MVQITENVSSDSIAREWRCKWSTDDDKASLASLQKVLEKHLPSVKAVAGVKGVQRVVCGGCLDFKVITKLSAEEYGKWSDGGHAPEAEFLEEMKAIPGVSQVETQTYTLVDM